MTEQLQDVYEAFEKVKTAVLCALDDAYSDGMDMSKALQEINEVIENSSVGPLPLTIEDIYIEWREDRGI